MSKRRDSYRAWHCPKCADTGEVNDITVGGPKTRSRCPNCDGFGVVLLLEGVDENQTRKNLGERWPAMDVPNG